MRLARSVAAGIAIILGVDRILDMCRTSVNVLGDLVACVVVDRATARETPPESELAADAEPAANQ